MYLQPIHRTHRTIADVYVGGDIDAQPDTKAYNNVLHDALYIVPRLGQSTAQTHTRTHTHTHR